MQLRCLVHHQLPVLDLVYGPGAFFGDLFQRAVVGQLPGVLTRSSTLAWVSGCW